MSVRRVFCWVKLLLTVLEEHRPIGRLWEKEEDIGASRVIGDFSDGASALLEKFLVREDDASCVS